MSYIKVFTARFCPNSLGIRWNEDVQHVHATITFALGAYEEIYDRNIDAQVTPENSNARFATH